MIGGLRHRGLRRLYRDGDARGVPAEHTGKLRRILTLLDVAQRPDDMDVPGWRLHPLKGTRKGEWSVRVSGNWRVTWRFEGKDATDIDYEDYH